MQVFSSKLFGLLLALATLGVASATAQAEVPRPAIPAAGAERCVEPTEVMRRDHFKFIMHQRDETVINGIRTSKHSFKGCIDCHVQPTAGGDYPRITSDEHFCATCHTFSAVKIDCFSCHSDLPEAAAAERNPTRSGQAERPAAPSHAAAVDAYLAQGEDR